MVKDIVFLVEGETEEIIVKHLNDIKWFGQFQIDIKAIINVGGNGNFCTHNISKFVKQAETFNPYKIVILTDMDCSPCVEETKNRLGLCNNCVLVLAKKAIESWFLADTDFMRKLTINSSYYCASPEATLVMPFDEMGNILRLSHQRGTGPSKPRFAKRVIRDGFSIDSALTHTNATNLQYFKNKLGTL